MRVLAFSLAATGALVSLLATACEPIGPIAGGRLGGEVAGSPPSDWSFANRHETIEIETRPESPHSVTVWCVSHDGALYVPTRDPEKKHWVSNVLEDPRVRVRVGGVLYEGRAVRVTDPAELDDAVPALLAKYEIDAESVAGVDAWLFRIDPPRSPARAHDAGPSSRSTNASTASRSG